MKLYRLNIAIFIFVIAFFNSGCKKFVEVDAPVTSMTAGNIYNSDYTAISALTAIYMDIASSNARTGIGSLSLSAELSADNLVLYDVGDRAKLVYYKNELTSNIYNYPPGYWSWFYALIYQANAAIEGLSASNTLTPIVKDRLIGEAMFIRAFCFYYLVNLYGDVPLVLTTDYKVNAKLSKTPKEKVYEQMISDLKAAKNLLTDEYQDATLLKSTAERIRPNKSAAAALLSRVYLFFGDYPNAESEASFVIENNSRYKLVSLGETFLKNSDETIWALQPVIIGQNTWEGITFQLPDSGPGSINPVYFSEEFISTFENNDQRLNTWVGNVTVSGKKIYYPAKYKAKANEAITEYEMVLRLGELYLVRAEARARQNKLTGPNSASADLEAIRTRAGLPMSIAQTQQEFLNAILEECRCELFTEWGHRWFALKHSGRIDEIMSITCLLKGGIWKPYKALYPILQTEIENSLEIIQNPGY